MASLQWWACKAGKELQKFAKVEKVAKKTDADFTKTRFLIKVEASGNRNAYISKEKLGEEYAVKLSKKPDSWRSWFIMDARTSTIRLFTQRHLALSNKSGKGVKPGASLVMRAYSAKDDSQPVVINGKKIENKKSKRCLSTANNENKDEVHLTFWPCTDGKDTQKWTRVPVPGAYEELCKEVTKNQKRFKQCPGKNDEYLGPKCKRHVERVGTNEMLVKKCPGQPDIEIHSCERYQEKGSWFRKCGEDHLESVKNGGPLTEN